MPNRRRQTKRRGLRRKTRHVKKGGISLWPFTRKNKIVPYPAPFPSQEPTEQNQQSMSDYLNKDMERIGVLGQGKSTDYNVCITKYPDEYEEEGKYNCTKTHMEANRCVPDETADMYYGCDVNADFRCNALKKNKFNNGFVLPCGIKKNHFNYIWSEITKPENIASLNERIQKIKRNTTYKWLSIGLDSLKSDILTYVSGMIYIPEGYENVISAHILTQFSVINLKQVPPRPSNTYSFFNYLTKEEFKELQRSIGGIVDKLENNRMIPQVERIQQNKKQPNIENDESYLTQEQPTFGGSNHKLTHRRKPKRKNSKSRKN